MKKLFVLTMAMFPFVLAASSQAEDLAVETVMQGLQNPSSVSFSPSGDLTVCDSRGTVVLLKGKEATNFLSGFDTEFWKSDDTGKKWYGVGPLSAIWVGETLVVTDSGKVDGEETLLMFSGPGKADAGIATNSVGPTSDDEADKGEGNLTGLSASPNGKRIFVCGQGYDGKSWVLSANPETKKLKPLLSADDNGIETNSPMQTVFGPKNTLYVLYSGKGGEADGLIVQWDLKTKKPIAQWKLPGLINPMGMAHIEGNRFAVVENNWSLTKVNQGRVVTVELGEDGKATVTETGVKLNGPVACAFGPDNRLYVSQIGEQFDATAGSVVAIKGVK
ncbi:hypothetical protein FF011L_37870 [Roseimaritima multifibrata]|uniref:SMP-30/Gluconolaconase/LRE-like region n=1 Tax=Roseimaritima multifibrata TaxID=1930274 RepID=A0A517MJF1_9BACT|nr:hypothetical protein [Roseimaritima multifibrata]QDS95003.1 hypothetical protein FF011L_37870 [Roseimaritima multifibrata]